MDRVDISVEIRRDSLPSVAKQEKRMIEREAATSALR